MVAKCETTSDDAKVSKRAAKGRQLCIRVDVKVTTDGAEVGQRAVQRSDARILNGQAATDSTKRVERRRQRRTG